jgi:outer membrane protein OmpA-like peptidoglycan-associated protein
MKKIITIMGIMIILLLNGCTNKVEVILLPKSDGSVGKVLVSEGNKETLLNQPWQKVETKNLDKKEILSKEIIEANYKILLEGMPQEEKNYRLYFKFDSSELTEESNKVLKQLIKDLKSEPILQIDVIGYSDRAGDEAYNKILSLKRAKNIIAYLTKEGISNDMIVLDYYGEANPIVPTADGVPKKVNRRVEVTIK